MTGPDYRTAITKLGMTINGSGRFFSVGQATAHRWVLDGPPGAVDVLLPLMLAIQRALFIKDVPGWVNLMIGRKAEK